MYLNVNGVRLYYEKTGVGRPLVMVHCNSMDHKIFRRAVKSLSVRFTVYCPDSRDHGKSEKVKKLRNWGLFAFVAIPLPGTGAWTGALIAAILDIRMRKSLPIIALGVLTAGIIVASVSYGLLGALGIT